MLAHSTFSFHIKQGNSIQLRGANVTVNKIKETYYKLSLNQYTFLAETHKYSLSTIIKLQTLQVTPHLHQNILKEQKWITKYHLSHHQCIRFLVKTGHQTPS